MSLSAEWTLSRRSMASIQTYKSLIPNSTKKNHKQKHSLRTKRRWQWELWSYTSPCCTVYGMRAHKRSRRIRDAKIYATLWCRTLSWLSSLNFCIMALETRGYPWASKSSSLTWAYHSLRRKIWCTCSRPSTTTRASAAAPTAAYLAAVWKSNSLQLRKPKRAKV